VSKKPLRRHREWKLERLIGGLIRVPEPTIVDHNVADNWADIARYVPPRTYRPTKCLQTQHFGSLGDTTRRKMPPKDTLVAPPHIRVLFGKHSGLQLPTLRTSGDYERG
jgi:hypothetical protein